MKPTAKHNDEELRELLLQLRDISTSLFPKLGLRVMNEAADEIERLLASLKSARADTRRYQWLIENEACVVESLDEDVSESERYEVHLERLLGPVATGESPDAAIDRAATSAEGEA